jgi:hypothetical protein
MKRAALGLLLAGCAAHYSSVQHQITTVGSYTIYSGSSERLESGSIVKDRYDVFLDSRWTAVNNKGPLMVFYIDRNADGFNPKTDPFGVLYRKPTEKEFGRITKQAGFEMVMPTFYDARDPLGCIDKMKGFSPCTDAQRLAGITSLSEALRSVRKERGNDWFFKPNVRS